MLHIGYVSCSPCYGLQYMLLNEGHRLSVLVDEYKNIPDYPKIKDVSGLVRKFGAKNLKLVKPEQLKACDFIFIDYNDMEPGLWETIHSLGLPVVGPDDFTDLLEEDREFGKRIASMVGLHVNEGRQFTDKAQAVRYLKSLPHDTEVFLKGAANSVPATNIEEAIDLVTSPGLAFFERAPWFPAEGEYKPGVYIDTKVKGYEVAYGAFWTAGGWHENVVFTREFKHAMPRGQGSILTGEVGTAFAISKFVDMPPAFRHAFKGLSSTLKNTKFCGFIDINAIVNDEGTWFLEWTTRPGYPTELEIAGAFKFASAMRQGSWNYGRWLHSLALGQTTTPMPQCFGLAASLYAHGLGLANYDTCAMGLTPRVYGLNKNQHPSIQMLPFDLMWDDRGNERIGSWDRGLFMAAYSTSPKWTELSDTLHNVMQELHCWGHQYREDLFDKNRKPTSFRHVIDVLKNQKSKADRLIHPKAGSLKFKTSFGFDDADVHQLFALELRSSDKPNTRWEHGNFKDEDNNILISVKDDAGIMRGAAIMQWQSEERHYLTYITVEPLCRLGGIGRKLLAQAEQFARREGSKWMELHAEDDNVKAWYAKMGYVEVADSTNPGILMEKKL